MGSRHNLYLATCVPIPARAYDEQVTKYTAVAYFANGPIEFSQALTAIGTVDRPALPWEGTQRIARLGTSTFSSHIVAGGAQLRKGELAGTAILDNEDFACFKDGQVAFVVTDDLSKQPYSCNTNYWCPSIAV
ncbi:hypothetical protein K504DRAFT_394739 [Pleomassaria siparia CBS 279.74]|uniref:Uncharacterized protein n=1 Tax=Pleomassaria siparia CBS 279.74 TaxID=1314801 RepID=A0A6G1KPI9_9PLEO|nr:hypothetical protein K504DRAFT_394739 [Pleomassaria siparia CBS 279.74]